MEKADVECPNNGWFETAKDVRLYHGHGVMPVPVDGRHKWSDPTGPSIYQLAKSRQSQFGSVHVNFQKKDKFYNGGPPGGDAALPVLILHYPNIFRHSLFG